MANNFLAPYIVQFLGTASASGVKVDLKVGMRLICVNVAPSIQNRVPIFPDDKIIDFGVRPGERIILTLRETSNNARTFFYAFRFTPLRMR